MKASTKYRFVTTADIQISLSTKKLNTSWSCLSTICFVVECFDAPSLEFAAEPKATFRIVIRRFTIWRGSPRTIPQKLFELRNVSEVTTWVCGSRPWPSLRRQHWCAAGTPPWRRSPAGTAPLGAPVLENMAEKSQIGTVHLCSTWLVTDWDFNSLPLPNTKTFDDPYKQHKSYSFDFIWCNDNNNTFYVAFIALLLSWVFMLQSNCVFF